MGPGSCLKSAAKVTVWAHAVSENVARIPEWAQGAAQRVLPRMLFGYQCILGTYLRQLLQPIKKLQENSSGSSQGPRRIAGSTVDSVLGSLKMNCSTPQATTWAHTVWLAAFFT